MKREDKFLDWLNEQSYWVKRDEVHEKFPKVSFRRMVGVTAKLDDDGDEVIPRRDLRNHLEYND